MNEENNEETKEEINVNQENITQPNDEDINNQEIQESKIDNEPKEEEKNKENESEVQNQNTESMNDNKTNKKNSKFKIVIILIMILIIISTIFALININNRNILNGISVKGIDLSGLSKQEALDRLSKMVDKKIETEINVKYEEYESTINPKLMETKFDIEEAVEQAYSYGRDGNIIENNYAILSAMLFKKDIPMDAYINKELTIKAIEDVGTKIPGYVKQYSYYIEDNKLIVTRGTAGLKVLVAKMYQMVYENLNDFNSNKDYIIIPVDNVEPNDINIDEIYKAVYKEPKNAYYETNPFTIYPEVDGINFDLVQAKEQINQEYKQEYQIDLQITKAEFTTDDVGAEAFPDVLATFTTKYDASQTNRTTNLRLASNKINGVVLMPGEEFSYNKIVGERTIEAGYKEAKIYSGGKVIDGLGGGICQVSSTLYNSVLMSNLEITERHNHQFVTSYVKAGRDATVVWGVKDFKFVNNRNYPIKIEASVKNGICKISIYGVKEEIEYDVEIEVEQISVIPYATKYEENNTLDVGVEKIKQNGTNGRVTSTYKVLTQNGMIVSRTLLSKDTYNAMQKIVIKGTKVKEKEKVKETNTQNENFKHNG